MYGAIKVVIIVMVPTIGRTKELVTPTLLPPFAITKANSPPEEDNPIAERKDIILSIFWSLADTNTVANFATIIKTIAGIIKSGINLKSIRAPTDTKNNAAKISLTGVDKTEAIACDFDSAINTPAKKAPAATEIPNSNAKKAIPKAKPTHATINTSC